MLGSEATRSTLPEGVALGRHLPKKSNKTKNLRDMGGLPSLPKQTNGGRPKRNQEFSR